MSFRSNRRFRLWDYNVSHNQLLLRSPQTPGIPTNIDIVIWGVEYLDLASMLDGVELAPAVGADLERAEKFVGRKLERSSKAFCLISGDRRSLVVASGFKVLENTLDVFESSLEYFAGTDSARDLGTILAHSREPAAGGSGPWNGLEDGAKSHRLSEPSSSA